MKCGRGGKAAARAQLAGWASLVTCAVLGVGPTGEAAEHWASPRCVGWAKGRGKTGLGLRKEWGHGQLAGLPGQKGRGRESRGSWAFGPKLRRGEFSFSFCFSFISNHFKTLFKSNLNYFEFDTKPHITTNNMHQHVCSTMLLHPMINFNLMKNYYFPRFHEHKNSELNHFSSISK